MGFRLVRPDQFSWVTRPHEPGEPARHVAELSDLAGFTVVRGNVWRYDPGAKGRRHRHALQAETFVVLQGTLSMYVGDPAERQDVPAGGVIHVEPGTALQSPFALAADGGSSGHAGFEPVRERRRLRGRVGVDHRRRPRRST